MQGTNLEKGTALKINDYMSELASYDFATDFADYDRGYICDIISEIADSSVSIYTKDQIDYAMNHEDSVEEALTSGIAPDASEYFKHDRGDFRSYVASVGAAAWFRDNERAMYDNIKECVLYAVCTVLKNEYGIEELTEDQIGDLEFIDFDINDYLEYIIEEAVEAISMNDDETEDEE